MRRVSCVETSEASSISTVTNTPCPVRTINYLFTLTETNAKTKKYTEKVSMDVTGT